MTAPITLDRISLRRNERAFAVGGSASGKSTLLEMLGRDFVARYAAAGARRLILDSKPRYRAQFTTAGLPARRRYKGWDHGAYVVGSVVVDDPTQLSDAFDKLKATTVIMQCETSRDIGRLVAGAAEFLASSRARRPQLLQVDETLDFFHSNGAPRGGDDAIVRSVRAGRERGTAVILGSQRTHGMPPAIMEELVRLYAFRLDFKADAKRLQEMGAPADLQLPTKEHQFVYWTKADYSRVWGPYTLALSGS